MTGTAMTEAAEFMDIYNLDVVEIPTNLPVQPHRPRRRGLSHARGEDGAIVAQIADCHRRGQPVLVGTVSIEKSEDLDAKLKDRKYIREIGKDLIEKAKSSAKDPTRPDAPRDRRIPDLALEQVQSDPAQRAERALPRAGSLHRRAGRALGRGDDRHQHGRPRHRHSARRQSRHAHPHRTRRHHRRSREERAASRKSAPRSPKTRRA